MSTHVENVSRAIAGLAIVVAVGAAVLHSQQPAPQTPAAPPRIGDQAFKFRSGVELINVTATVTDASGRFVPGLKQDDFIVYENDQLQTVTHFNAERVPVSLGIAVDTSGSMAGTKMQEAQGALDKFLYDLLDQRDEIFLYRFSNYPALLQDWTTDRQLLARALARLNPTGGTAMYDAVAEAIPLAQKGQNRKKALLVISDGNDTSSRTSIVPLKQIIRESEVLVYAIGIDGDSEPTFRPPPPRIPLPIPVPFPRGRGRGGYPPPPIGGGGGGGNGGWQRSGRVDDRVNVAALRDMTDDSGGRTEIIRDARDLNPSTASIADELSKQYYLGYTSTEKKDGRWHDIRVALRNKSYRVRARRGYVAS